MTEADGPRLLQTTPFVPHLLQTVTRGLILVVEERREKAAHCRDLAPDEDVGPRTGGLRSWLDADVSKRQVMCDAR